MYTSTSSKTGQGDTNLLGVLDAFEHLGEDKRRSNRRRKKNAPPTQERRVADRRLTLEERQARTAEQMEVWRQVGLLITHNLERHAEILSERDYPAEVGLTNIFNPVVHETFVERITLQVSTANLGEVPLRRRDEMHTVLLAKGDALMFEASPDLTSVVVSESIRGVFDVRCTLGFSEVDDETVQTLVDAFISTVFLG